MIGAEEEGRSPVENRVLRAQARGEISADAAFEVLFREYRPIVASWLAVRADGGAVDDLAQDVWLIFYNRLRRWEFGTEMESEDARPVLSFLFRTCQFVARGHARLVRTRRSAPLEEAEGKAATGSLLRELEAAKALSLARRICSEEEVEVLLAKLEEVREEWRSLRGLVDEGLAQRFANAAWTLKDLLAHLASWAREFTSEIAAASRNESFDYAIPFAMSVLGPNAWNEREVLVRKDRSLDEIFREFDEHTERLEDLVAGMEEAILYSLPPSPSLPPAVRRSGLHSRPRSSSRGSASTTATTSRRSGSSSSASRSSAFYSPSACEARRRTSSLLSSFASRSRGSASGPRFASVSTARRRTSQCGDARASRR